jgi:riboflavin synthase
MFTGIVAAVGRIEKTSTYGDGLRLEITPGTLDVSDIGIGDSVAVSGCCLTVVEKQTKSASTRLMFDVSAETLRCTVGLDAPGEVNLEKALRLADRLGGHLMTGHVDGVGTVVAFSAVETTTAAGTPDPNAGSWRLDIEAPVALARYIAAKGSIAVAGVSLTVNGVDRNRFNVNLIPHTLEVTTLKDLRPGSRVNLEIDLVARYVERLSSSVL